MEISPEELYVSELFHSMLVNEDRLIPNFSFDVPSVSITRRYGKLAYRIYKNLLNKKCISKLDYSSFKTNYFQLLYNLYSKTLYYAREISSQVYNNRLKTFISSLPSIKTLNKTIYNISNFDFCNEGTNNKRRVLIKKYIKKAALIQLLLIIYEHYYLLFDFPFYDNYLNYIKICLNYYKALSEDIFLKVNEELKLTTNFFSRSMYFI